MTGAAAPVAIAGIPDAAILPIAVAAGMFLWWLWLGRDPRPGTIVPAWRPPEGLRPGPAGALIDQHADPGDVLATILDLARRGYLAIVESHPAGVPARGGEDAAVARELLEKTGLWTTEWRFVRTDRPSDDLLPFEASVLVAIFGAGHEASARALRKTFAAHVPGIYAALSDDLTGRGYFLVSPARARREWHLLAAGVAAAGALLAWWGRLTAGLALLASAGVIALFARWMPVATVRGARMRDRVEGLREYIRRAEKDELELRHAAEAAPGLFDEILPWAVALGVSDLWLDEFRPLARPDPAWYTREGGLPGARPGADLAPFFTTALTVIEGG